MMMSQDQYSKFLTLNWLTYLSPVPDFSGELGLTVIAISAEPDGDSGDFDDLKVELAPVVDQEDGQVVNLKASKTAK
ncbi:hypothetical protein OK016_25165 [Vibrio chagasii]|nr:hypothetical protein [Vibrio chagasii]